MAYPGPSNPGTCSKFQFTGKEAGGLGPAIAPVMPQQCLLGPVSFLHRMRATADAVSTGSQGERGLEAATPQSPVVPSTARAELLFCHSGSRGAPSVWAAATAHSVFILASTGLLTSRTSLSSL